jgi:hypothetical protein
MDSAAPFQKDTAACARKSAIIRKSKTAFRTLLTTLRTPSTTDSTSATAPALSAVSSATSMATSALNAPTAASPGMLVSKVEISPLPAASSLPSCSSLISHSCSSSSPYSLDCSTAHTTPSLPLSCSRFFLPFAFSLNILSRALLAMCRLVAICTSDTDCPSSYQLSHFRFVSNRHPHYLIITLPSCTLCVCFFSDVFLTRFTLRIPPMIQPPPDARPSLMRRF